MGYTHYWTFDPGKICDTEELRGRFSAATRNIRRFSDFVRTSGLLVVRGGHGVGDPIINDSEVWLNGDRANGEDHETFYIHWSKPNEAGLWTGFCKTARKPYDAAVCFALLSFSDALPPEAFKFSSDGGGGEDGWQMASRLYEELTGRKRVFRCDS